MKTRAGYKQERGTQSRTEFMEQVGERLRSLGFRVTPQRTLILAALVSGQGHVSAEDIYAEVRSIYPHVNISTVYRTLEQFRDIGLVTQTDLGGGCVQYHCADKGQHHHLVCQKCGRTIELEDSFVEPLRTRLLEEHQFHADMMHFAIFGRCAECEQKQQG
jgi:Fur family ferric uptake transcriptional regulator